MPEMIFRGDVCQDKRLSQIYEDGAGMAAPVNEPALRPLLRLIQLAAEIQRAVSRNDFAVMSQASALLAPALEHWGIARDQIDTNDPRIAALSEETQRLLAQAEQAVQSALNDTRERQNVVRQHQRRLKGMNSVRAQRQARTGRLLDASR